MTERLYVRASDLMSADVSDEMVALDTKSGTCFGFNAVATDIWKMLETPKSFAQIKASCLESYDVDDQECEKDLRSLLESLTEAGLVSEHADRGA